VAITAKSAGEARTLAPEGSYFGVCTGVYDLGTQPSQKYDPTHKVLIEFELHKKKGPALDKDGKPLRVTQFYPLAFGKRKNGEKAKLRQAVEGILGRSFDEAEAKAGYDVTQLAEVCCRLKVSHDSNEDGNKYEVLSYFPLDEDDPEPKTEANITVYELDPKSEIPDEVPDWIKKMVRKSAEWVKVHGQPRGDEDKKPAARNGNAKTAKATVPSGADDDEDLPF
jgi:hypothetical protein